MYSGDIFLESTIDIKFTTRRFSTGAPFALAGSPVISAYIDNDVTQLTAGITLSVDFDGVTGLNNVRVAATGANGYTAGTNVTLVITTGTVDSVSVVGEVVGSFSISHRPVNTTRILGSNAAPEWLYAQSWFGVAATGTLSTTQATSDLTGYGDDIFNNRWTIYFLDGSAPAGQMAIVTDYVSSTGLFTFAPALTTPPVNGNGFILIPAATGLAVGDRTGALSGAVGSVTAMTTANVIQVSGDSTAADNLESYLDGSEFMPVDAHAQDFSVSGTTLTTKKPDGTTDTAYSPKTLTTDPAAEPITGAS